jgi:hypothetical protein
LGKVDCFGRHQDRASKRGKINAPRASAALE